MCCINRMEMMERWIFNWIGWKLIIMLYIENNILTKKKEINCCIVDFSVSISVLKRYDLMTFWFVILFYIVSIEINRVCLILLHVIILNFTATPFALSTNQKYFRSRIYLSCLPRFFANQANNQFACVSRLF